MGAIIGAILAILKLFGIGAEAAKEAGDQRTGADLQAGADAKEALDDAAKAIAARDAVRPLRPDGLRDDGTPDPDARD